MPTLCNKQLLLCGCQGWITHVHALVIPHPCLSAYAISPSPFSSPPPPLPPPYPSPQYRTCPNTHSASWTTHGDKACSFCLDASWPRCDEQGSVHNLNWPHKPTQQPQFPCFNPYMDDARKCLTSFILKIKNLFVWGVVGYYAISLSLNKQTWAISTSCWGTRRVVFPVGELVSQRLGHALPCQGVVEPMDTLVLRLAWTARVYFLRGLVLRQGLRLGLRGAGRGGASHDILLYKEQTSKCLPLYIYIYAHQHTHTGEAAELARRHTHTHTHTHTHVHMGIDVISAYEPDIVLFHGNIGRTVYNFGQTFIFNYSCMKISYARNATIVEFVHRTRIDIPLNSVPIIKSQSRNLWRPSEWSVALFHVLVTTCRLQNKQWMKKLINIRYRPPLYAER